MASSNTEGRLEYEVHVNTSGAINALNELEKRFGSFDSTVRSVGTAVSKFDDILGKDLGTSTQKVTNYLATINTKFESIARVINKFQPPKLVDDSAINVDSKLAVISTKYEAIARVINKFTPPPLADSSTIDVGSKLAVVYSQYEALAKLFNKFTPPQISTGTTITGQPYNMLNHSKFNSGASEPMINTTATPVIDPAPVAEAEEHMNALQIAFGAILMLGEKFSNMFGNVGKKQEDILKKTNNIKTEQKQVTEEASNYASEIGQAFGTLASLPGMIGEVARVGKDACAVIQQAVESLEDATVILGIIRIIWQAIMLIINQIKKKINETIEVITTISKVLFGVISITGQVYGQLAKIVGKIAEFSLVTPVKSLFSYIGDSITGIYKKVTKFIAALQRIALYRMIRFLMKQITQAVSGALENIYQYSLKVSNKLSDSFRTTMDDIASDFLYMKNSIASVLAPAIEILEPLVRQLINLFVEFANKVAQVVATLNGQTSFLKAKRIMTQYAEEANKATEANKELKKSFAGLDEITVIGQNDSSSSSDKDNNELDYANMFEVAEIDSKFAEIGRHIKELWNEMIEGFNNGNLTSFGTHLAEDINGLVQNIDKALNWKYIGDKVTKFISTIATGFNALVDPKTGVDFKGIGKAIGGFANTVINSLHLIFTKFNWPNLFKGLADVVNGFFEELNPQDLADMVTSGITTVFDSLTAFIDGLELPSIMDKIIETLEDINYDEIFQAMSDYVIAIFGALGEAFQDPEALTTAIMNFTYALNKGFLNIALHAETFAQSMSNIAIMILNSLSQMLTGVNWKLIGQTIARVLGNMNWTEISTSMGNAASALVTGLVDFVTGLTSDTENWNKFVSGMSEVLTTLTGKVNWGGIWEALKPLIVNFFPKIVTTIKTILPELFAGLMWLVKTLAPMIMPHVIWLAKELGKCLLDELKTALYNGWKSIAQAVDNAILTVCQGAVNFLIDFLNEGFIDKINFVLGLLNSIAGSTFHVDHIGHVDFTSSLPHYAIGGFPEDGLFMANHGELVGKFSNGKTAVANNEQIVEGIARGVASANDEQNSLLRTEIEVLKQILAKDSSINVNTITRGLQEQNRRAGRSVVGVY